MLLLQVVASGIEHGAEGDESDELGPGNPDAACSCSFPALIERDVHRGNRDVGEVHRNLCDAVLIDKPPDGLGGLQGSRLPDLVSLGVAHNVAGDRGLALDPPFLAHVEGDRIGAPRRRRVQVDVVGDEEIARSNGGGPGARLLKTAGPKSGCQSGSVSFSARPSYSPARTVARLRLSGCVAARS